MGAVVPEALAAAERPRRRACPRTCRLRDQPRAAVPRAARPPGRRAGRPPGEPWILEQAFPAARATPLVTVLDGHPHTLSFLATVNRVPHAALGVAQFGQSGSIEDLYRYNGIDTDSIIRAALDLVPLRQPTSDGPSRGERIIPDAPLVTPTIVRYSLAISMHGPRRIWPSLQSLVDAHSSAPGSQIFGPIVSQDIHITEPVRRDATRREASIRSAHRRKDPAIDGGGTVLRSRRCIRPRCPVRPWEVGPDRLAPAEVQP